MKIAMIGQRGVPATFGGVERHVEELGARLVDRGHEVIVFCRRGLRRVRARAATAGCALRAPAHRRLASTSSDRAQRDWPPRRPSGTGTTSCTTTPSGPGCSPRRRAAVSRARSCRRSTDSTTSGPSGARRQRDGAARRDVAVSARVPDAHDRRARSRSQDAYRDRVRPRDRAHRRTAPRRSRRARPAAITERWGLTAWLLRAVRRPAGPREGTRACCCARSATCPATRDW